MFSSLLNQLFVLATVASLSTSGSAFSTYSRGDGGVVIVPPPAPTDTGIKQIPDADHPYQAPGPNDQRGPCPGLNTLANHGYIPRNGIASFEQIVEGVSAGFSMDQSLSFPLAAFGILARGNAFTNQLSIGGPSSVPPLPGNIDGNVTKGIATHGRFEGDISMTRSDAAIGDNRNFNQTLFNELLAQVAQFGNDSDVTGPKSIVNVKSLGEFKAQRFIEDQKANPELEFHAGRLILSYGETSFTLNFFANGTDGTLSVPTMTSFFRDQRFPENWHRRPANGTLDQIGDVASQIQAVHPEVAVPGVNAPNGTYIPDTDIPDCVLYQQFGSANVPAVLLNTTGVLKQNVDLLLNIIFETIGGGNCTRLEPVGEAGI